MDPDATLQTIHEHCWEHVYCDADTLAEAVDALRGWLARGGFEPDWDALPDAASYFSEVTGF